MAVVEVWMQFFSVSLEQLGICAAKSKLAEHDIRSVCTGLLAVAGMCTTATALKQVGALSLIAPMMPILYVLFSLLW